MEIKGGLVKMATQRAYPRLIGGVPDQGVQVPYVGVMEMQKILNQIYDDIYQLQGGSGASGGAAGAIEKKASATLPTIHGDFVVVPGMFLDLEAGAWMILAVMYVLTTGLSGAVSGTIYVGGTGWDSTYARSGSIGITTIDTVSQGWLVILPNGGHVEFRASQEGLTPGAGEVRGGQSKLLAWKVGSGGTRGLYENVAK